MSRISGYIKKLKRLIQPNAVLRSQMKELHTEYQQFLFQYQLMRKTLYHHIQYYEKICAALSCHEWNAEQVCPFCKQLKYVGHAKDCPYSIMNSFRKPENIEMIIVASTPTDTSNNPVTQ